VAIVQTTTVAMARGAAAVAIAALASPLATINRA